MPDGIPGFSLPPITRDSLNEYLKDLGKEYRRLSGGKTPAEIVLVGGAAVLVNYGFRDMTDDVDAVITASSAMKDAIGRVRDKHGLLHGWLNADFRQTGSYSDKLLEVSVYYRTFSNVLSVRTVADEYLLAMKLMSGRQYKNDLSDAVGILWEHQKNGKPLQREVAEKAIETLYGTKTIPGISRKLLNAAFAGGDYEALYRHTRDSEEESKELLLEFERTYPGTLKDRNIDSVIEQMKRRRDETPKKDSLIARLEEVKRATGLN